MHLKIGPANKIDLSRKEHHSNIQIKQIFEYPDCKKPKPHAVEEEKECLLYITDTIIADFVNLLKMKEVLLLSDSSDKRSLPTADLSSLSLSCIIYNIVF